MQVTHTLGRKGWRMSGTRRVVLVVVVAALVASVSLALSGVATGTGTGSAPAVSVDTPDDIAVTSSGLPADAESAPVQRVNSSQTSGEIPDWPVGDPNRQGGISIADAQAIANYVIGNQPSPFDENLANVTRTNDGVQIADAQRVAESTIGAVEEANVSLSGFTPSQTVESGGALSGNVTVENLGEMGTIHGVTYRVATDQTFQNVVHEERVDVVDLAPRALEGNTTTVQFTAAAKVSAGEYTQGLFSEGRASGNASAMANLTVKASPEPDLGGLEVGGAGSNTTVSAGVDENVAVNVTNVGDVGGSFDVTLAIGTNVSVTESTATLNGSETTTLTFENVTGDLAPGTYPVTASTPNDSVSGTLTVEGGLVFYDDFDRDNYTNGWYQVGGDDETVEIRDPDVLYHHSPKSYNDNDDIYTNDTFEATGIQTIGGRVQKQGGSYWEYIPAGIEFNSTVIKLREQKWGDNDKLVVKGPGTKLASATSSNEWLNYSVTVNFETQEVIEARRGNQRFTPNATVAAKAESEFRFVVGSGRGHEVEYDSVWVYQGNATEDPGTNAEPELAGLDVGGQGANATVGVGADENVTVNVTNVGDVGGSFNVTLSIGTNVSMTESIARLNGSETTTLTLENVTGDLAPGTYPVTVSTSGDSVSGTLTVDSGLVFYDDFDRDNYTNNWSYVGDDETAEMRDPDVLYHHSPKNLNDKGKLVSADSFNATGIQTIGVQMRTLQSSYWGYGIGVNFPDSGLTLKEHKFSSSNDDFKLQSSGGNVDFTSATSSTDWFNYSVTMTMDTGDIIEVRRDGQRFTPDVSIEAGSTYEIGLGNARGYKVEYDAVWVYQGNLTGNPEDISGN